MTANELAVYLDNNVEAMLFSEQSYIDQAATMLRQQQAEIEALKLRELTDEEIISEWIGNDRNYYNFARAILKKARDK